MDDFVERAFAYVDIDIAWSGAGEAETGKNAKRDEILIEVDPRYFRPTEVDLLIADPNKAKKVLGWTATASFDQLVSDMMAGDLKSETQTIL